MRTILIGKNLTNEIKGYQSFEQIHHTRTAIAAYEAINKVNQKLLETWDAQLANVEQTYNIEMARTIIGDIESGEYEVIAIIDDNNNLVSIADYYVEPIDERNLTVDQQIVMQKNRARKVLFIERIASTVSGTGMGTIIVRDLMQIGQALNIPLMLIDADSATSYWKKMGFERAARDNMIWFPKGW